MSIAHDLTTRPVPCPLPESEEQLIELVLDGVTSEHSRRSYRTGLAGFFTWIRSSRADPAFTKALVQRYRAKLLAQRLSSSTINVRLAAIRKMAREMADNQMLDDATAAAIGRVPLVKKRGTRIGNWLTKEQANTLLNAPPADTLAGKRNRAILALLVGCGLRRAELLQIEVANLQLREGRWVLADLLGKGNRLRTVTVPESVKARVDAWLQAAGITSGRVFRAVNKGGLAAASPIVDEKAIWRLVTRYARQANLGKLAPHDLRRTCAKLCRTTGGELEQIQLLLGHASIQTTERYLGTEQAFAHAVNDGFCLDFSEERAAQIPRRGSGDIVARDIANISDRQEDRTKKKEFLSSGMLCFPYCLQGLVYGAWERTFSPRSKDVLRFARFVAAQTHEDQS